MEEFQVKGLSELTAALDEFPMKFQKNVLRGALRAGAKVQAEEEKRQVPVETTGDHPGALKQSIRITTSARGTTVRASVKAGGKSAWWAWWVEQGTKPHLIKPNGAKSLFFAALMREAVHHPGAKANPFAARALQSTAAAALSAVVAYIRQRLTKQGIDVPGP